VNARRALLVAVAIVGLALSACGGTSITAGAASELATRVQAVRAAASSGNRAGAKAALADLRAAVASLRRQGAISGDKAGAILAAASDVEANLSFLPTTTTRPSNEGNGKGHGKHGGGD
jgi:ribosomal protein S20